MATLTAVTDRTTGKRTRIARSELCISDDLVLPVDAVTQVIGFLGRRGSGKTYAATKLAEQMLEAHAQLVVLDPVGVWYGLRLGNGFDIPVLGGLHGDIPLEPSGGALVADLIVDRGISAVLDVSQMIPADLQRFALGFGDRFFQRKKAAPSAVALIMEECQEFVPENPQRGGLEPKVLHAYQRAVKLGRNFGIGCFLISQRPQEISKKVLNQTELLFAFQMSGPQERKTLERWIADKGIDEDIKAILPKLEVGQPRAWSPQWLKISKTIRIAKKRSLDASSTPKVGERAVAPKALTPIDLEELRGAMSETVERAKQDDPKFLRARIAELEKAAKAKAPTEVTHTVRVEVPVLPPEQHAALLELSGACFKVATTVSSWKDQMDDIRTRLSVLNSPPKVEKRERGGEQHPFNWKLKPRDEPVGRGVKRRLDEQDLERRRAERSTNGSGALKKGQREVLTVVAQNVSGATRTQISTITRHAKSTRNRLLYELQALGYVHDYGSHIGATEAGLAALGDFEPLPTGAALREHWFRELPEGNRRVLEVLCSAYPKVFSRDEISDATGHAKSTRNRLLYELAARQLVETFGAKGGVRASSELFD